MLAVICGGLTAWALAKLCRWANSFDAFTLSLFCAVLTFVLILAFAPGERVPTGPKMSLVIAEDEGKTLFLRKKGDDSYESFTPIDIAYDGTQRTYQQAPRRLEGAWKLLVWPLNSTTKFFDTGFIIQLLPSDKPQ